MAMVTVQTGNISIGNGNGNHGYDGPDMSAIVAGASWDQADTLNADLARREQTTRQVLFVGGGLLAGLALVFLIFSLMK